MRMLMAVLAFAVAADANASSSLGWHLGHPKNCGILTDSQNVNFYVITLEGDLLFASGNPFIATGMQITCDSGNFLGWHVVDSASGRFDQTVSFTFK